MIHLATAHLESELNDYFNARSTALVADRVARGSLYRPDGTPDPDLTDRVVLSVVNVVEERVYHAVDRYTPRPDGTSEQMIPEVRVNLYVLFTANHTDYDEALKAIAQVVSFFQHRAVFRYREMTGLEAVAGRMTVELCPMTFEQQNHLWGTLGAKYVPSVLYKVGILDIKDEVLEAEVQPVSEVHVAP